MNLNSATLMYSAVSLNEKQASSREKASRRRSKRDKYLSGDIDDDEFDDLQSQYDKMAKMNPEKAMWKAGSVLGAAGTIVTNAIAIAVETLAVNFVAGSVAVVTSTTVAYREIFDLEDIQSTYTVYSFIFRRNLVATCVRSPFWPYVRCCFPPPVTIFSNRFMGFFFSHIVSVFFFHSTRKQLSKGV